MFQPITRGLQMMASFLALFIRAAVAGNVEAVSDGASVARQWIRETTDEAGLVKINVLALAFGNSDPWRDSRSMWRAYEIKWKGRL